MTEAMAKETNGDPTPDTPLTCEDIAIIHARWENRRRMAWLSFGGAFILIQQMLALASLMPIERFTAVRPLVETGLYILAAAFLTYMGLATISEAGFWTKK